MGSWGCRETEFGGKGSERWRIWKDEASCATSDWMSDEDKEGKEREEERGFCCFWLRGGRGNYSDNNFIYYSLFLFSSSSSF